MNFQYVVYFITQTSVYDFYDRHDTRPLRRIQPEEVICHVPNLEYTLMVVDALNDQGLI
jgi:hypothetical protein